MEYVELEDKRLSVHSSFNADFHDNYTLNTILQEGEKVDKFEVLEKTSRSMWPEHETVGITYETDDFEIDIRRDRVRIRVDDVFEFDSIYDEIQTILYNTSIEVPPKRNFKTDMISLYSQSDEYWLTYDETKCEPSQEFGMDCYLETDYIQSTYSQMQGIVTFSLAKHLTPTEIEKAVESIINKNIIILNTKDEIDKLNESFKGGFD